MWVLLSGVCVKSPPWRCCSLRPVTPLPALFNPRKWHAEDRNSLMCAHTYTTQTNRDEWTAWLPVATSDDITPSHPLPPWPNFLKREWQDLLFYVTTYFVHSFSLDCSLNMSHFVINLFCTERALPPKRTAKCFCLCEYMCVNRNTSPLWWLGSSELCMTWPRSDYSVQPRECFSLLDLLERRSAAQTTFDLIWPLKPDILIFLMELLQNNIK